MLATKTKAKVKNQVKPKTGRSRPKTVVSAEVRKLQNNKQLSPAELGELARQLAEAKTKTESARLRDAIMRGFYGAK